MVCPWEQTISIFSRLCLEIKSEIVFPNNKVYFLFNSNNSDLFLRFFFSLFKCLNIKRISGFNIFLT